MPPFIREVAKLCLSRWVQSRSDSGRSPPILVRVDW